MKRLILLIVLWLVYQTIAVGSAPYQLSVLDDVTLRSTTPNTSINETANLVVGDDGNAVALLRFPNSTGPVSRATLVLAVNVITQSITIDLYDMKRSWGHGATWEKSASGETYLWPLTDAWSLPGAFACPEDRACYPFVSATILPSMTEVSIDITNAVQRWNTTNYGFVIRQRVIPKRGASIPQGPNTLLPIAAGVDLGLTWGYSWSMQVPQGVNDAFELVPMATLDDEPAQVAQAFTWYPTDYLLMYNEPDLPSSGSYWYDIRRHARHIKDVYEAVRVVKPNVKMIVGNVFNSPKWLGDVLEQYIALFGEWPPIAGWGLHIYTDYLPPGNFRPLMEQWRTWQVNSCQCPDMEMWLTEFGGLTSTELASQVMAEQIPWLQSLPWLNRYAWYGTRSDPGAGALVNTNGNQYVGRSYTSLGQQWRTLRTQTQGARVWFGSKESARPPVIIIE